LYAHDVRQTHDSDFITRGTIALDPGGAAGSAKPGRFSIRKMAGHRKRERNARHFVLAARESSALENERAHIADAAAAVFTHQDKNSKQLGLTVSRRPVRPTTQEAAACIGRAAISTLPDDTSEITPLRTGYVRRHSGDEGKDIATRATRGGNCEKCARASPRLHGTNLPVNLVWLADKSAIRGQEIN